MKKLLILIIPIVFFLSFCQKNIGGVTASEIDNSIILALKVGDSKSQIDKALTELELLFTFDEYANRYQAIIANNNESCLSYLLYECSVGIYVYTDQNDNYKYHEVEVFYSGL
jgi:hypothetical protein